MEVYEHYKDSGVPWIDDVPSTWTVASLARFTRIATGNMDTVDAVPNGKYPLYVRSPIVRRSDHYTFDTHAVLMSGDGAGAGRIFHRVDGKFGCHQRVYCIEFPDGLDRDFGYYYLSSFFPTQVDAGSAKSTVDSIRLPMLKGFRLAFPDIYRQRVIAAFLDAKTAEIDGVIEGLVRQRELLERYKRELIAHTVTKGLDPETPMEESGLQWIGQIPTNWSLLRIGALYDERSTKVSDSEFPPLSVTMKGILPQLESVAKTNDRDNRKLIRAGDFVINSRSDRRGACGIANQDGSCSLINIVLQPRQAIFSPYFSYLFRSNCFSDEFYKWGHGIVDDLWTTNWGDMKKIQVPVPPLADQEAIAAHLETKTAEIDGLIGDLDRQIELLGRYRKQVINDVVTGKVRVSEVA